MHNNQLNDKRPRVLDVDAQLTSSWSQDNDPYCIVTWIQVNKNKMINVCS